MQFRLAYTQEAMRQFRELQQDKNQEKRFKAVVKALRFLTENPKHPSLNTHKFESLIGPAGVEVFEAYAEDKTAGAYRIFWCYYPPRKAKTSKSQSRKTGLDKQAEDRPTITILAITAHPD